MFCWDQTTMPFPSCFHNQVPLRLFQVLPVTLTKENKSLLTQHFDQVQSGYSCYSNIFLLEKINTVSENRKEKKTHNQKSTTGFYKTWPCCPDALFLQLGLITAPDVSNPSASGVIQIFPKHQEPAKLPELWSWERHSLWRSSVTGRKPVCRRGRAIISLPALSFRSTVKITWFKFNPCLRSATKLPREVWDFWSLAPGQTWPALRRRSRYAEVAESPNEPVLLIQ